MTLRISMRPSDFFEAAQEAAGLLFYVLIAVQGEVASTAFEKPRRE
jgi:hypothetical protein